jgi:hypothetical protein
MPAIPQIKLTKKLRGNSIFIRTNMRQVTSGGVNLTLYF